MNAAISTLVKILAEQAVADYLAEAEVAKPQNIPAQAVERTDRAKNRVPDSKPKEPRHDQRN